MQPTGCLRDSACRLRRRGWCSQVCATSELQLGALREVWRHARGREHYHRGEPGSALSHQIRRRRTAARSSTSQGSAEPLCVRIKGANREVSEGKADVWPWSFLFPRRPTRSGERVRFVGLFQGWMHRALDGWILARAPTSLGQGLHHHHHGPRYFNFPYSIRCVCGLEKLGLVDRN